MADEKDPIAEMLSVDDEAARGAPLPEAELNTEAPADKAERERDEAGKFKGKDGEEKKPDEKKPEVKAEEKPKETVPLATFLEKTNKLKADLEARDITLKQFQEKLAALEAKLPKPQEAPAPDFVEDPKAYVDHGLKTALEKIAEANKKAEESGKKAQETAEATQQHAQLQRMMGEVQARERAFIAENPDYFDALNHIRDIRAFQLREFNPEITDQQIMQVITHEETNLAAQLLQQGKDPTSTAYNLAKRYGYQPKAKQEAVLEKLPEPATRRLPPDQTLGTGSPEETPVYKEGESDPVDIALASLFKKRA